MKLALNGQWKELSGLIYTYPDKISGIPEWAISLPDPRNVRGLFKGDYCYALWYNSNGYYYACTKTNTDSRNGCVMLTLFAEKNVPLDGKKLAEKMRLLLDYCLSKNDVSEIAYVDFSIRAKEIEGLLVTRKLPKEMSSPQDNDMAYRLYSNEDELGLILENPNQPNYVGYKRVLLIDGQQFVGEALNAQSITKITEAVKKTYDIRRDSNDVSANKESVMDGETFTITYRKQGFIDSPIEVVAGKVSPYYTIDGNVINLRSAEEAGVVFRREVVLQVFDEETNRPIKEWSCKIDGGKWIVVQKEDAAKGIRLPLEPNKSYKLVATAEGYEAKSVEIASGDYGIKKIHVHSLDESVFVRLQIGEKVYSDSVRMKSNNMLYYPLKRLDQNNRVLQVKRPFFSRRNLMPILALFLASFLIGGVLGRFVLRGGKDKTETATVDSTQYNKLKADYEKVQGQLETAEQDKISYVGIVSSYGKTLSLIKVKIGENSDGVVEVLSKSKYENVLKGEVNSDTLLVALIGNLDSIQQKGSNQQPPAKNQQKPNKESQDDLENQDRAYFAANQDVWDLSKIESDKYKKLVEAIKHPGQDQQGKWGITTMISFDDSKDPADKKYNNLNWGEIRSILAGLNADQYEAAAQSIGECVRDGKFYLKELVNKLNI